MADNQHTPPRSTDTLLSQPVRGRVFEGGQTRAYLENFVSAAYQSGPDAQFEYERALAAIRTVPEAIVIEIATALGRCDPRDYATRWALIFAACELRHGSALPLLASVAGTPLPPEPQSPSHGFSIVANETVLRTTAIEGIGHLAREGHKDSADFLFGILREPSISLRRAAVQAILGVPKSDTLVGRVKASLPPELHFLLELKKPGVTDVPQVPKPEQYLSEEARGRAPLKPPLAPGHTGEHTPSRPPTKEER